MYSTVDIKKRIGTLVSTVHISYQPDYTVINVLNSLSTCFQTLLFLF